jgi:hypothetical protein
MNSKTAQLRENGTEIVRLFARFALGASFLMPRPAAAAAFLLAFWEPDRFTLDKLLNRLRN